MASCNFVKYKLSQEVKAHMRHNDNSLHSRKIAKKKNKHIDLNKTKDNFSILGLSYEECCAKYDTRIAKIDANGNKNKRKDRVTALGIEIPVPADLPHNQYKRWFMRVSEILRERYGDENFLDGKIHVDEVHEYRNAETGELTISRVHGHFLVIPETDGKLNAKKLTTRANFKLLNRKVDDMTQKEFGCRFMTGTKKRSYKTVEELKQMSEYTEIRIQLTKQEEELTEKENHLRAHLEALKQKEKELEEREAKAKELQEEAEKKYQEAVRREQENQEKMQATEDAAEDDEQMQEERTAKRELPPEWEQMYQQYVADRQGMPDFDMVWADIERMRNSKNSAAVSDNAETEAVQDQEDVYENGRLIPFEFLGLVPNDNTHEEGLEL